MIQKLSPNDILLWPDGTWFFREAFKRPNNKQLLGDYQVIPYLSPDWFCIAHETDVPEPEERNQNEF